MVNVVRKQHVFRGRKIRQLFQIYFGGDFDRSMVSEPTIGL